MLDYVAWYVVELQSRLAPYLTEGRVSEIIKEAEGHLRERSRVIQDETSASVESAAVSAINAFGSPESVALSHLRMAKPTIWGVKPIWWVFASMVVALFCWEYPRLTLQGPFDRFEVLGYGDVTEVLIGVAALILFSVAIRRSYRNMRRQVLGLALLICLLIPPLLSFWMITAKADAYQGVSRFHVSRDESKIRQTLHNLDSLQALLPEGGKSICESTPASRSGSGISRSRRRGDHARIYR